MHCKKQHWNEEDFLPPAGAGDGGYETFNRPEYLIQICCFRKHLKWYFLTLVFAVSMVHFCFVFSFNGPVDRRYLTPTFLQLNTDSGIKNNDLFGPYVQPKNECTKYVLGEQLSCCSDPAFPVLGGLDVVAMLVEKEESPIWGEEAYQISFETSHHGNYKFYFKSRSNMVMFAANPEKYLPIIGGFSADILTGDIMSASENHAIEVFSDISSASNVDGQLMLTSGESQFSESALMSIKAEALWIWGYLLIDGDAIFNTQCLKIGVGSPDLIPQHPENPASPNESGLVSESSGTPSLRAGGNYYSKSKQEADYAPITKNENNAESKLMDFAPFVDPLFEKGKIRMANDGTPVSAVPYVGGLPFPQHGIFEIGVGRMIQGIPKKPSVPKIKDALRTGGSKNIIPDDEIPITGLKSVIEAYLEKLALLEDDTVEPDAVVKSGPANSVATEQRSNRGFRSIGVAGNEHHEESPISSVQTESVSALEKDLSLLGISIPVAGQAVGKLLQASSDLVASPVSPDSSLKVTTTDATGLHEPTWKDIIGQLDIPIAISSK